MIDTQRDRKREKQAPCREPDAGLDPGTPGSCPGPKAGAKLLRHPGTPRGGNFKKSTLDPSRRQRRSAGILGRSRSAEGQ